jgi:hypothetical protein
MVNSSSGHKPDPATIRALAASPRLPIAKQRRLSFLMERSRETTLTAKETAELEIMLDDVDRKSFWMLAGALARKQSARKRASATK